MDTPGTTSRRLLATSFCAAALAATSVLPATAAPRTFDYDALGDSFAAGSGANVAHPQVLDGRMRISLDDLAAVSGATIPTMLAGQLGALDADTDLVTISIGGNDIGWAAVVTACTLGDEQQCATAVEAARLAIQTALPVALDHAYTAVRAQAPNAHIVVTGYPRLFSPEHGDYAPVPQLPSLTISVAEQQLLNEGADLLNQVIAATATSPEHDFQFVDVTKRFVGHGVNAPDAWLTGATDPVPLHPTDEGQHAYGVALRSQINPTDLR